MLINILWLIGISALTALASLCGGFLVLFGARSMKFFQKYGAIFAAIVLVYAAFFDLIPESIEEGNLSIFTVAFLVFIGAAVFALIRLVAERYHKHGDHTKIQNHHQAISMLIVDSLHNIVDGIVIGLAFASGLGTGILAAVATAAHEIPQEIGDFSIMVRSKMPRAKIIKLQIISALFLVPAAIISFFIGDTIMFILPQALALIAGFFICLASYEIWDVINLIKNRK